MNTTNEPDRFEAPPESIECDGLLFDLDGTIVESTAAIEAHWRRLGAQLGVDPVTILATAHGRRSIDTLQLYDPSLANWEYISEIEGRIPREFGATAGVVPGSRELLAALEKAGAPWTLVTSGTRALATGWLTALSLPTPTQTKATGIVTAEDVMQGKPDPACYTLGRKRLGLSDSAACIVIEDAPAGVRAGKAAGFRVVGVATTHAASVLRGAGADWVVRDLRSLVFKGLEGGRVGVVVSGALL